MYGQQDLSEHHHQWLSWTLLQRDVVEGCNRRLQHLPYPVQAVWEYPAQFFQRDREFSFCVSLMQLIRSSAAPQIFKGVQNSQAVQNSSLHSRIDIEAGVYIAKLVTRGDDWNLSVARGIQSDTRDHGVLARPAGFAVLMHAKRHFARVQVLGLHGPQELPDIDLRRETYVVVEIQLAQLYRPVIRQGQHPDIETTPLNDGRNHG